MKSSLHQDLKWLCTLPRLWNGPWYGRPCNEDPLIKINTVTFQPGTAYRVEYGKKRVGKPRQNWIHQTKKCVYIDELHLFSYDESKQQDDQLLAHAGQRQF